MNLSVVGLSNPVRAGKELTYEIKVTNTSASSYREVGVTAIVPEGMVFSPLGTAPATFNVKGQTVRFNEASELRPGGSLVYRVRVQAKQPGPWRFRAELTAATLAKPLQQEAGTEVN